MQRNPRAGDAPPDVEPTPSEPNIDDGVLAWLEDLLIKMIVGVFRFICVKLPSEFYRALVRWFPTLVRLGKVLSLLTIWLVVTFGPLALSMNTDPPDLVSSVSTEPSRPEFWKWCAVSYTAVALCGSVWGAMYVRRLRKQGRSADAAR